LIAAQGPRGGEAADVWVETLARCGVTSGQKLIILKSARSNPENTAAAFRAGLALTPHVAYLEVGAPSSDRCTAWGTLAPYHMPALGGNRMAVDTMKAADLVIDTVGMARGGEQHEILSAGARVLLVKEPPHVLQRLFSTEQEKARVLTASKKLAAAKTMRVKSDAGTDLRFDLGQFPLLVQYGLADEPGRWDHWPSAFVAAWPNERSAEGTVVLDSGDIILPFKEYLRTPVSLTIRKGYVEDIHGAFEADYLRSYMAMFNDREGYAVSHLGWGLMDTAQWAAMGMFDKALAHGQEARSFAGNFMFSTGPNTEAGGERDPYCHLDMPMRNCSVLLDDELVVAGGRVLDDPAPKSRSFQLSGA
jgi:2,5-dihydroxypyridine 5,6-dioxygenase